MASRKKTSTKRGRRVGHQLEPGPERVRRADSWQRSEAEQEAWRTANEVLARHRDDLLSHPGVISVEVAPQLVDGDPRPNPSIRVHVYRKRNRDQLGSDELLPDRIDGVPVDVIPSTFRATACQAVSAPLFRKWPRLQGGCTIGRRGDRNVATLAALFVSANQQDTVLGLTAGHAFAQGDVVIQPAGGSSADSIGQITDRELSDKIDAAIITIDFQRRPVIAGVAGAGGPLELKNLRVDGEYVPVFMAGGCTGWTVGWARRSSGSIPIDYPSGQIQLTDYIHITSGHGNVPFNQGGDSGALLLSQDGQFAHGLVVAVGEFEGKWAGIAIPIDRIARRFNLQIAV